jgi:hypothetical protein
MKRKLQSVFIGFVSLSVLLLACGCEDLMVKHEREMQQRQDALAKMNAQQAAEIQQLRASEKKLQTQVDTLKKIGDKRPDALIQVTRIRMSNYTGGLDRDKKAGHEALKIMFAPEDAAGDPIKTAGAVKIELYDLDAEEKTDKELGVFNYDTKEALKHWAGGMLTNHYSFTLPIPKKFKGEEITVRVEFTDYMSGKIFKAQKVCQIQK